MTITKTVVVREHARLTTEFLDTVTLDRASISQTAFDWLCQLSSANDIKGAALVHAEGRRWLRLDNFVGVIETPCGTILEILPKIATMAEDAKRLRLQLQKMISASLDVDVKSFGDADLHTFDLPMSEWVIRQFLVALNHIVQRGVRSDYIRVEDQEKFLRGQLDLAAQLQLPEDRKHLFCIKHDVFTLDRAENRLIRSTLHAVVKIARDPFNWRRANELRILFESIPESVNKENDFKAWSSGRLMAHYQPIKPWCELILSNRLPFSTIGSWHGLSMLFPMEKLFEAFVVSRLRKQVSSGTKISKQVQSEMLCKHDGGSIFQLRPDIVLEKDGQSWVLDTKWKRINALDRSAKYDLNQGDFYQLLAYGRKYLLGAGEMALIYPMSPSFTKPLPVFEYDENLKLWVLPFDLEEGRLLMPENGFDFPIAA